MQLLTEKGGGEEKKIIMQTCTCYAGTSLLMLRYMLPSNASCRDTKGKGFFSFFSFFPNPHNKRAN